MVARMELQGRYGVMGLHGRTAISHLVVVDTE